MSDTFPGQAMGGAMERMVPRLPTGRTVPGATAWQQYGDSGIFVDVDTSAAGLSGTPVYVPSLGGDSCHWRTTGGSSVYAPTATGFRVYVSFLDGAIDPAVANSWKWHVNWIAAPV